MIGYVTLGSNDLDRARTYYDDLFGSIGAGRLMEFGENFTLYGTGWGSPGVAICTPHNGEAATAGNGNMVAIVLDSRDKVDCAPWQGPGAGRQLRGCAGPARPRRPAGLLRGLFPRSGRQ